MILFCTFVPAPIFCVLPIRIRTSPRRTFLNSSCFFASVSASWINLISDSGIPRSISFCRISVYTENSPAPFGVERSQKRSCVSFLSLFSSHIRNTSFTQALTLLPSSSGSIGFIIRWSRASFRPSFVTLSILSTLESTLPPLIFSARSPREATISFCTCEGFTAIL